MLSYLSSSLVFSTIEYFSYLNLWLIILFLFLCLFFLIFSSCQLLISSILCSGAVFEFSLIFLCFLFIVIIISPALIILLDSEIIIVPSFIVYSCGYQWAWTFSFYYVNWISNCDHYLFTSFYIFNTYLSFFFTSIKAVGYRSFIFVFFNNCFMNYLKSTMYYIFYLVESFIYLYIFIFYSFNSRSTSSINPGSFSAFYTRYNSINTSLFLNFLSSLNTYCFYFFTLNSTILIPILSTIRFFVFSYDVIHSLGIYSFGIKIDAIPGRFNFTSTIRTLIKGEHRGFCYELCGYGHSSMLIVGMVLLYLLLILFGLFIL